MATRMTSMTGPVWSLMGEGQGRAVEVGGRGQGQVTSPDLIRSVASAASVAVVEATLVGVWAPREISARPLEKLLENLPTPPPSPHLIPTQPCRLPPTPRPAPYVMYYCLCFSKSPLGPGRRPSCLPPTEIKMRGGCEGNSELEWGYLYDYVKPRLILPITNATHTKFTSTFLSFFFLETKSVTPFPPKQFTIQ